MHLQRGRDADLFDDFTHDRLPADEVYVPPHHQPVNPEDEDDVVPDQHAAFGIARATQARLARQRDAGVVRRDIPVETLAAFLSLVYDGLVAHLATGMPVAHLDGVVDLVEQAVRETATTTTRSAPDV